MEQRADNPEPGELRKMGRYVTHIEEQKKDLCLGGRCVCVFVCVGDGVMALCVCVCWGGGGLMWQWRVRNPRNKEKKMTQQERGEEGRCIRFLWLL